VYGGQLVTRERALRSGQGVLHGAENQRQRGAKLVTDVAEERGLGRIELPQLGVRVAQLAVGVRQLPAASDHVTFHLVGSIAQLSAHFARVHELRHVFDAMQDVQHLPARRQHRQVLRAPVLDLEATVRTFDVVLLHGHRVRRARREHAVERGAQVARSRRAGIVRIVRKDLEQAVPDRLFTGQQRGAQACGRGRDHREAGRIGQEGQQNVRGLFEQELEVEAFLHRRAGYSAFCGRPSPLTTYRAGALSNSLQAR
jgi:hypothetical protein